MGNVPDGPAVHGLGVNQRRLIGVLTVVFTIGALAVAVPVASAGAASQKVPALSRAHHRQREASAAQTFSTSLASISEANGEMVSDDDGYTVSNYTSTGIDVPAGITSGPDGALWFVNNGNDSIGRITTGGVVTNYTDPSIDSPAGMTVGPDGALWFTNSGSKSIGRITTSGVVTNYTGAGQGVDGITTGPDGAMWFTNLQGDSIGRITTAGVVTTFTGTGISAPSAITAGPDGALWFTNLGNDSIGRITTAGVVTNFTSTAISGLNSITAGPDGALWFTCGNDSIGRITTAGVVTTNTDSTIDNSDGITTGPDGALWFDDSGDGSIGRITTAGVVTSNTGTGIDLPNSITTGPDGALWFTNDGNNSIGSIRPPVALTLSGTPPSPVDTNSSYDYPLSVTGSPSPATTVTSGSLPPGLSLSAAGVITGSPTTAGTYTATVTATNGVEPDDTDTFTIVVYGVPPSISGTPPTDVSPGTAYSFAFSLAGTPSPTTTVTSGSLPPGLSLSEAGVITGSPTTAGTYTVTATATNGISPDASDTFTIAVLGAPTISGAPTSPVDAGEPYSFEFTLSGAPSPTTTVSSGALPPGLGLSPDGVITGTPITAGTYSATVDASNGIAPDATINVVIAVDPVLAVSPESGVGGTPVDLNGAGFEPGESVNVTYDAPPFAELCSAPTVAPDGTFSCTGEIPAATAAGKLGLHTISATGTTSLITANAEFKLIGKSPTLTAKPFSRLIGNKVVDILGKHWPSGADVEIDQCADDPTTDPGSCIQAEYETANRTGSWSVDYVPVIGEDENACAAECYIEATDGSTDLVTTLTFRTPTVEIKGNVSNGIYLGQKVNVAVRSFPAGDPVTIEICSFSTSNCDSSTEATETLNRNGSATFRGYIMSAFVCSPDAGDCFILAQDSVSNGPVVATEVVNPYCGPIVCGSDAPRG
jgi:streptogramin lyase